MKFSATNDRGCETKGGKEWEVTKVHFDTYIHDRKFASRLADHPPFHEQQH